MAAPKLQSLVPNTANTSPDYFCTWNIQGSVVEIEGTAQEVVDYLAIQLPPDCGPARQGTADDL